MSCSRRVSPSARSESSPDCSVRAIAPSISLLDPSDTRNDIAVVRRSFNHGFASSRRPTCPRVGDKDADLSCLRVAVVPIRIVGDPVLHTATEPDACRRRRFAARGSRGVDQADLYRHDGRRQRCRAGRQPDRRVASGCSSTTAPTSAAGRLRRRGVVVNPVLETSEVPETMPDPRQRRRGLPVGAGRVAFRRAGPIGAGDRPGRRRLPRSRSRAPACSRGCCSTRPATLMASCI